MNPIWYARLGILGVFVGMVIAIVLQHSRISDLKAQMALGEAQAQVEKTTLVEYINKDLTGKITAQTQVEARNEERAKTDQATISKLNTFAHSLQQSLAEQTSGSAGASSTDIGETTGAFTRARQEAQACWKLVYSGIPVVAGCAADAELLRSQVEGLLDDAHSVCRGESLK